VRKETGRRGEEKRRKRKEKKMGKNEKKRKEFFSNLKISEKDKRYLGKLVKNYFC
jgi:hypothetical protein